MSLELCVLGSGSSGNSTIVRAPWGNFLIDAGFGPRVTAQRLHGTGVDVPDLSAIVLTHLDSDHFNPYWLRTILKQRLRVFCARKRARELTHSPEARDLSLARLGGRIVGPAFEDLVMGFDGPFEPVRGVRIDPLALAHDAAGSHGFLLECDAYRVGYATDLGHVPETLIERFCGVDVLALESNYDPEMELQSDRPWQLKERIMGGRGHLSNEQSLAAVQAILDRTTQSHGPDKLPRHIVLLHRSRECNCPKLLHKLFAGDPRIAPILTLAHQHERTGWLSARRPRVQVSRQLALAWGDTAPAMH